MGGARESERVLKGRRIGGEGGVRFGEGEGWDSLKRFFFFFYPPLPEQIIFFGTRGEVTGAPSAG